MSVDKYTAFTIFDWNEESRPEIKISQCSGEYKRVAHLHIGGDNVADIAGKNNRDLKLQLEGYAEIFAAAAESLGGDNG